MKYIITISLLSIFLYGENTILPVSVKTINWKEKIVSTNVKLVKENSQFKCKKYLDINTLKKNKYRAKHYILKNKAICLNDVFIQSDKKVRFDFGFIEIEKEAKIIKETDQYIKIKNLDGTMTKIYKNGRNK